MSKVLVEIDAEELAFLKRKAERLEEFESKLWDHLGSTNEDGDFEENMDGDVCTVGELTLDFFNAWL